MSLSWRPGMQCVCINDDWSRFAHANRQLPSNHPVKGRVYDVIELDLYRNRLYLVLLQIDKMHCWLADHFRPVKPTDISKLKALLAPIPKPTIVGVDEDIFAT